MPRAHRWFAVAIALVGCRGDRGASPVAATPVADDARVDAAAAPMTPPPPTIRPGATVPVVSFEGRRFLKLTAWASLVNPSLEELERWGRGPVQVLEIGTHDSRALRLQPADEAPAHWRALIGAAVPAYQADGTACALTIAALVVATLGYPDGDPAHLGGESDEVLAELAPVDGAPPCAPVLATVRQPQFFAPVTVPPRGGAKAVMAAFTALPAYRHERRDWHQARPRLRWFADPSGPIVAVATIDGYHEDGSCMWTARGLTGAFELSPGRSPRMRGASAIAYGTAAVEAVLDSDGDGVLEAVLGIGKIPVGADGRTGLGSLSVLPRAGPSIDPATDDAAPDADPVTPSDDELAASPDLDFDYTVGCD